MTYLFGIAFIISSLIKLLAIWGYNFAFTPDQGRDLIDIRGMIVLHAPRLVGPTTSINGLLLGPFYYYFISLPFLLFRGNPAAIVIWQIAWFQIATLLIWYVLKKKSLFLGNITGILLLLSPVGFYTARYFWNANTMPIFTILFFATLFWTLEAEKRTLKLLALGLISGLSLQIEAAFGLLFFPFAFLVVLFRKFSFKDLLKMTAAFTITLLPQVLFELHHGFMMTKTMIAGLSGTSNILGEKLSFAHKLSQRQEVFLKALRESSHVSFEILGPLLLVSLLVGVYYLFRHQYQKNSNEIIAVSLAFLIFSIIFYLCFPQEVKGWYVLGLSIPIIIFLSGVLENVGQRPLGSFTVWLFIIYTFYHTLIAHTDYLSKYALKPSADPSNMNNELKAIDWVYTEADGEAFKVYSYLPSIYDYPYQYLFWWYGTKKFGYQPADIAYLPHQPEYIKNNDSFWSKKKPVLNTNSPIFLIIQEDNEHQDRLFAWQGNFAHLCKEKSVQIVPSLSVVRLSSCQEKTKQSKL